LNPEFKKTVYIYEIYPPRSKNHRCKSPFHNKTVDILVVDGFIKKIAVSPNSDRRNKIDNLHVSQGWFDSSVSLGEPGEERETIVNGFVAAKAALRLLFCKLPLLTIKHKLTLFRINEWKYNFSQLAL
jgi:dihydroorotase-like cyclic amidohydrolase